MIRYIKVWWRLAHISFAEQLTTRFSSVLFLVGKVTRFLFFLVFLFSLVSKTGGLAGYSKDQIILFFLVFNIVDVTTQLFFRGVYFFRHKVVTGELDFYLAKPMHPLFRIMAGHTDFLDLVTLIALLGYFGRYLLGSSVSVSAFSMAMLLFMLVLSFLVALAIHIIVASIGVLTTEVDHTIMIYRDLTQMGRIPVDVYAEPVRAVLTFVVPVALMMTVPAKALMGLVSLQTMVFLLFFVFGCLFLSLRFWRYALSQYSSASS